MADEPGQRSSSGSGRSSSNVKKQQTPQQQLSTIERSVTHLLVATKQLLETLTQWSRGNASENEVSDVYVRLGYEFNIACRAFNAIGVDTQDLGPVPDLLRQILEETLSQEASQTSLDRFLPKIRDIIINLLHGLKKKQQRIRQRPPREGEAPSRSNTQDSVARTTSGRSTGGQSSTDRAAPDLPPRTSSVNGGGRDSPSRSDDGSRGNNVNYSDSDSSSISSNTMQNIPVITPYPAEETIPAPEPPQHGTPYNARTAEMPPPPPPPKQQDALLQLQRGGDLERRASRRFSTYQIKQQLGSQMPVIPPAQNSPVPNRGREVRESMQAVRTRGSMMHTRKDSSNRTAAESSPNRPGSVQQPPISEEIQSDSKFAVKPPLEPVAFDRKPRNSDEAAQSTTQVPEPKSAEEPILGATLSGPITDPSVPMQMPNGEVTPIDQEQRPIPARSGSRRTLTTPTPPPHTQQFVPEDSPQPGKPLTLFLQYKSRIKKIVLEEGSANLTVARLQLAFIEKFSWNTHNNGVDLPDIYIQDQVSGVRHELEDISDIKDRCVLVLNVEALDEVKRHFDDGIGGLRQVVESIKTSIDNQQSALDRVSDRQQETAKELASLALAPPSRVSNLPSPPSTSSLRSPGTPRSGDMMTSLTEVQRLRRDLATVRQTYSSFVKDVEASMSTIRTKAASVKSTAVKVSLPDLSGDTGRAYVTGGKKQLSDDSENIVKRVDGVLDHIEDLRKDVVSRGVRPLPRQLEDVAKDISSVTGELKRMKDFLKKEKPLWSKIWEQELAMVCEERDMLTMNEELVVDLEGDLESATQTLELVEEATKQQMADKTNSRSTSGRMLGLTLDQVVDPQKAKDGVLTEVKALQPNHETSQNRLEAIERAEKLRQKELESRKEGEFKRELGAFVAEGKLNKTGGAEEAERLRKSKDERIRREVWERQNGIVSSEDAAGTPPAEGESEGEPAVEKPDALDVPSHGAERNDSSADLAEATDDAAAPAEPAAAEGEA